jgi:serine phosphatase RsbU (regulator of sigma subunit)
VRSGNLKEIKGDNMPIGISSEAGKSFTGHALQLQKDDAIYLFTDGFVDQLGGERRKRFTTTRFKKLLLDIQDKIMFEQRTIIEHTLNAWMGVGGGSHKKVEQTDDIIVMGIKV